MAKYLRKKEFRYDTNPKLRNKNGKGHVTYMTVQHGNRAKVNVITHSGKPFFGKPTKTLSCNPKVGSKDPRPSRISVPFWEDTKHLQKKPFGTWQLSKKDEKMIHKMNRQCAQQNNRKKKNKGSK